MDSALGGWGWEGVLCASMSGQGCEEIQVRMMMISGFADVDCHVTHVLCEDFEARSWAIGYFRIVKVMLFEGEGGKIERDIGS